MYTEALENAFKKTMTIETLRKRDEGFNPYVVNGGSSLAICGNDYCIIASDTRQSDGYSINCRYAPRSYKLSDSAVLTTSECYADGFAFAKDMFKVVENYKYKHQKDISIKSLAQAISMKLYSKRFFPYYTNNILGGVDSEGKGIIYAYDAVGSYNTTNCAAAGSASDLILPILDNQVSMNNRVTKNDITQETATNIAIDSFNSAVERDIYTGDYLEIWTIKKNECKLNVHNLKKD